MFKKSAPTSRVGLLRRRTTRAVFFLVGFGMSVWAPLVPYAKERLGLSDGHLGLLLLCLGAGSIITMPITGILVSRFSCRAVIIVSSVVLCLTIPMLAFASSPAGMAISLLFFGAAVGAIDVAGNIQAVIVQRESKRFMMSGFHAFYSIGGLCGAMGMSLLLLTGLSTILSCLLCSLLLLCILALCQKHLLSHTPDGDGSLHFAMPKGIVLFAGVLCFVTFLSEGIIFDWGSLFLIEYKKFDSTYAGIGMATFSATLALGRLWGNNIIHAMGGGKSVLFWGGIGSAIALVLAVYVLPGFWALLGYALLGISVSNIVPIIFSAAGQQDVMPVNDAISIVTTLGYTGTLLGPALIGFTAEATSLRASFIAVALLMLGLGLCGRLMLRKPAESDSITTCDPG